MKLIPGSNRHIVSENIGELFVGDGFFYNGNPYVITGFNIEGLEAFCEDTDEDLWLSAEEVDKLTF